jgi:hypothetical protein
MKRALETQKYNKILEKIWFDSIAEKFFEYICKERVLSAPESILGLLR